MGSIDWALAERLHRCKSECAAETLRCYLVQAGHLARLLGRHYVRALRRADIDEYIAQRTHEGVSAETRRKELVLLRSALRLVRLLGAETAEPEATLLPKLRTVYQPRERWLEVDDFEAVLRALPPARRLQILCACYVGGRRSELMRIEPEDIDYQRNVIRIRQTKPRGTVRYVPLHPRLRAELQQLAPKAGPLLGTFMNLYRAIERACKAAGVERFCLNDCRRTFGSWMLQEGAQPFTVGKLMGHSGTNMVSKVYGRLSDDSLRDAVQRLPGEEKKRGKGWAGKGKNVAKSTLQKVGPSQRRVRKGKPGGAR